VDGNPTYRPLCMVKLRLEMRVNRKLSLTLAVALLACAASRAYGREWTRVRPRIASEVRTLSRAGADALLSGFCPDSLKDVKGIGLTCSTRKLGSGFSDIVDSRFQPEGVIYGHFLSATSEDAAVSGWSAETHPYLWSGTLLLTKSKGTWKPLWYRSAVLTHSCGKAAMPSGREVLFCEAEDAGMGHVFHYVFSVDLTAPVIWQKSLLAIADSYGSSCVIRSQEVEHVTWDDTSFRLSIEIRTPQWRRTSTDVCAGDPGPAKRPPLTLTRTLTLTDRGFQAGRSTR
jgi:hypothetical protein